MVISAFMNIIDRCGGATGYDQVLHCDAHFYRAIDGTQCLLPDDSGYHPRCRGMIDLITGNGRLMTMESNFWPMNIWAVRGHDPEANRHYKYVRCIPLSFAFFSLRFIRDRLFENGIGTGATI